MQRGLAQTDHTEWIRINVKTKDIEDIQMLWHERQQGLQPSCLGSLYLRIASQILPYQGYCSNKINEYCMSTTT